MILHNADFVQIASNAKQTLFPDTLLMSNGSEWVAVKKNNTIKSHTHLMIDNQPDWAPTACLLMAVTGQPVGGEISNTLDVSPRPPVAGRPAINCQVA